jgi:hypothetical protein
MQAVPADVQYVGDDPRFVGRLVDALSSVGETLEAARLKIEVIDPGNWSQQPTAEKWFRTLFSFAFARPLSPGQVSGFLCSGNEEIGRAGDVPFFELMTAVAEDFAHTLLDATRPAAICPDPPAPPDADSGGSADDLAERAAEIRRLEDEFYERCRPDGRVIGSSFWDTNLGTLRRLDERFRVRPDDPRVYSIRAYLSERRRIEDEWGRLTRERSWQDVRSDSPEHGAYWSAQVRFGARHADCRARHFPGLDCLDTRTVDTLPKLWAYVTFQVIPVYDRVRYINNDTSRDRPRTPHPDLVPVYGLLHELKVPWAPPPPYQPFAGDEVRHELQRIANRLQAEEACADRASEGHSAPTTRDDLSAALPRSDPEGVSMPVSGESFLALDRLARAICQDELSDLTARVPPHPLLTNQRRESHRREAERLAGVVSGLVARCGIPFWEFDPLLRDLTGALMAVMNSMDGTWWPRCPEETVEATQVLRRWIESTREASSILLRFASYHGHPIPRSPSDPEPIPPTWDEVFERLAEWESRLPGEVEGTGASSEAEVDEPSALRSWRERVRQREEQERLRAGRVGQPHRPPAACFHQQGGVGGNGAEPRQAGRVPRGDRRADRSRPDPVAVGPAPTDARKAAVDRPAEPRARGGR